MDNRNDFLILDDDEKIVYTYKPNKTRIWFSNLLWSIVFALINIGIGLMFVFIPGEDGTKPPFEVFYIFLAISLVVVVLTIIFTSMYYKSGFTLLRISVLLFVVELLVLIINHLI